MENKYDNYEVHIDEINTICDDNDIRKHIEEENILVNILKHQIVEWKKSLNGTIENGCTKSVMLYQSFVILELYTKAQFFNIENVRNYSQEIDIDNYKKPLEIKHHIDDFIDKLLENDNIIITEKNIFRMIKSKIESLRNYTNLKSVSMYPDLRYNLNKNGEIIDSNLSVSEELIKTVKGVIDFANI